MTEQNKRLSVKLPLSPIRSREPSLEPRSRSNSTATRNSIDVQAREFTENCEKLATRHNTNKIQVILDSIIKVLEVLKN